MNINIVSPAGETTLPSGSTLTGTISTAGTENWDLSIKKVIEEYNSDWNCELHTTYASLRGGGILCVKVKN